MFQSVFCQKNQVGDQSSRGTNRLPEKVLFDFPTDVVITTDDQIDLIDAKYSFGGDLVLAAGVRLEIFGSVLEFDYNSRIIVNSSASLSIVNSTLSDNDSQQPMWQGIEVHGDPGLAGILNISGNSTIENAHIGVLVGERNATYAVDSESSKFISSKGEAHIDGCSFANCGYGVYVHQSGYSNDYTPPVEMPIEITNCTFETVGVLPDPGYLESSENPYPNESNPYAQSNFLGRGNTGLTVFRRPYIVIDDNNFIELETGIEQFLVRNDILNCNFENSRYGIRGWGGYFHPKVSMNQSILSNEFMNIRDPQDPDATIDDPLPVLETYSSSPTAAIELNGAQFFTIDDNDILAPNAGDFTENGIILDNSARFQVKRVEIRDSKRGVAVIDSYPDDFENLESPYWVGASLLGQSESAEASNDFFDCEAGILTDQNNLSLHLRCNNHDNGPNLGDKPYVTCWANSGMLLDQGRLLTSDDEVGDNHLAAGNTFLQLEEKLVANFLELEENDFDFEYVHHAILNTEDEILEPETVSDVDVLKIEDGNQLYNLNSSCDLPITLWTGNNHSVVEQQVLEKTSNIDGLIGEHQYLKASLDSWYTQTESMLNAIYSSSNQQELRDFLLENSPLSEPVLAAYMERYDVPHEYLADVVYVNSVVEGELRDLLQDRISDMPAAIAQEIEAVMSYNPDYQTLTQLKKQIEQERSWLGLSVNEWVKSVSTENDLDNLIVQLESDIPDVSFQYYLSQENYVDAQRVLNDIIAENSALQDWIDISSVELGVLQSGRDYDQLTSGEIAQIQFIHDNSSMGSEARSRAEILLACSGQSPPTYVPLLSVLGEDRNLSQRESLEVIPRTYPNPAYSCFQFEYAVGADDFAYVVIRNAQGQVVQTNVLYKGSDRHLVECQDWSSGFYLLELFVNNRSIWTGKMTRQ